MDYFSKQKIIVWSIVILVILNLGTLATLWIGHFQGPERRISHGRRAPDHVSDFLTRELNFDADQKKEFKILQSRQIAQMDTFQKEVNTCKRRMMDELLKTSPDPARVKELAGEVGEKEALKARRVFKHLQEIKAICRPEQKGQFDILVSDLLAVMKPPDHPGQPGDRGNGPPPHPQGERPNLPMRGAGDRMDLNGDGKVSQEEWSEHHREIFRAEIDRDQDGYASEIEWKNHHRNRRP
jgi:periplasmic protein CpxP/Spy